MKKSDFDEAFIRVTSLFIIVVIVAPIIVIGLLRLAQEVGVPLSI